MALSVAMASSSEYSSLAADSARTSLKRTRELFDRSAAAAFLPSSTTDARLYEAAQTRRLNTHYSYDAKFQKETTSTSKSSDALVVSTVRENEEEEQEETVGGALVTKPKEDAPNKKEGTGGILVKSSIARHVEIPTPTWHAPWKLSTVLSSHLGWVRSIAFDPTNDMFATGGADRVIKIWDLAKASVGASDALKITLTGHISPVRAIEFSERHPYLFSAGEDKQVKCWDLETNQVIRHYHGHLSGVFCLALHPTLDIMVTGGRDAVGRVWDIRTKNQIHVLSGHSHTVASVLTRSTDPQVITGSHDTTIKQWDLVSGKCQATLTHHQKSVRALCQPSFESTFLSGAADGLKKWQARDGRFLKTFTGHKAVINALAVNDDGVVVSGGDEGSLHFWDYGTGHSFQQTQTLAQPGSLEAENGIYAAAFDLTGTRLVTGEADKTVKIWKQDEEASEITHPIDMAAWRKKCLAEAKQRY